MVPDPFHETAPKHALVPELAFLGWSGARSGANGFPGTEAGATFVLALQP